MSVHGVDGRRAESAGLSATYISLTRVHSLAARTDSEPEREYAWDDFPWLCEKPSWEREE